jgi:hypothetical protein
LCLSAHWDAAETEQEKTGIRAVPSGEPAWVLVDQYLADRLAVFYLGLDALQTAWPGDGVHVYHVGAGTAVDGVPGIPVATSMVPLQVRVEGSGESPLTVSMPPSL